LIETKEYNLFPGQVIAIRGNNPYGTRLIVKELYVDASESNKGLASTGNIRVMAASGPFTSSDSLKMTLFDDLLKMAGTHKPNVIILMGPFVDGNHSLLKEGLYDQSFDTLFRGFISRLGSSSSYSDSSSYSPNTQLKLQTLSLRQIHALSKLTILCLE